jgi:hypothetical protein
MKSRQLWRVCGAALEQAPQLSHMYLRSCHTYAHCMLTLWFERCTPLTDTIDGQEQPRPPALTTAWEYWTQCLLSHVTEAYFCLVATTIYHDSDNDMHMWPLIGHSVVQQYSWETIGRVRPHGKVESIGFNLNGRGEPSPNVHCRQHMYKCWVLSTECPCITREHGNLFDAVTPGSFTKPKDFQQFLAANFTWEHVKRVTLEALSSRSFTERLNSSHNVKGSPLKK